MGFRKYNWITRGQSVRLSKDSRICFGIKKKNPENPLKFKIYKCGLIENNNAFRFKYNVGLIGQLRTRAWRNFAENLEMFTEPTLAKENNNMQMSVRVKRNEKY